MVRRYMTQQEKFNSYLRDLSREQKEEILRWKGEKDALGNDKRGTLGFVSCLGQFYRHIGMTVRDIIQHQDEGTVQNFFNTYKGGKGRQSGLGWYYYYIPGYFKFINEKFFDDDNYPKPVKWILKKKDRLQQDDQDKELVSDERLKKTLKHAGSTRNKALIMVLRDTAARPIEISRANIKDFDKVNNTLALRSKKKKKGKWAIRKLSLIQSLPYLQRWLEVHERKDDDDAPLFYCDPTNNKPYQRMETPGIRKIWRDAQKRAGFKDIISTYRLRHTRLTELGSKLQAPELKVYGGWSNIRMVDTYCHITDDQVNARLLQIFGKKVVKENGTIELTMQPRQCPFCLTDNPHDADFCSQCKSAISVESVEKQQKETDNLKQQIAELQAQMAVLLGKAGIEQGVMKGNIKGLVEK